MGRALVSAPSGEAASRRCSAALQPCRRIEISATGVRKVIRHFAEERERTAAWRRILEQTTGALLRQSASEDA
jgi:hypothetical protein